jgi:hypothetical protein
MSREGTHRGRTGVAGLAVWRRMNVGRRLTLTGMAAGGDSSLAASGQRCSYVRPCAPARVEAV